MTTDDQAEADVTPPAQDLLGKDDGEGASPTPPGGDIDTGASAVAAL